MSIPFAEELRRLRIEKGLSQQELGDLVHVDRSTVTKWEAGSRLPDVVMISRLSDCLDSNIEQLLHTTGENGEKPKIIVVDDERIILNGCIKTIENSFKNVDVTGFSSPNEAIDYIRNNNVAIVFLDIEMGRINGLDVCREILAFKPHTNIIYLTAYKDYSFDAWATGACGFILKPLTEESIAAWLPRLRFPVRGLDSAL